MFLEIASSSLKKAHELIQTFSSSPNKYLLIIAQYELIESNNSITI